MKTTLFCTIAALAVAGGVSMSATPVLAHGADAFNRPSLGGNWVTTAGSVFVSGGELHGSSLSLAYAKASNVDSAASAVVVLGGADLEYGAIALGNIAGGSNAFVKIQSQNGAGTFDHAAFYTGNNGSGTFFTLSSPVPSPAVLDVFFCGTVATMRITSGAGVQTYAQDYGTTFGPGGGLGTYGAAGLDNYIGFKSGCSDGLGATRAIDMPADADKSLRRR